MKMKRALFYTVLLVFIVTAGVTLLALTGVFTIEDGYLNVLVSAFLLETAAGVISWIRNPQFLEEQQINSPKAKTGHKVKELSARLPKLNPGWTLCLIGQTQGEILNNVSEGLRRSFSERGEGKALSSGIAYWGIIPTRKWVKACSDPGYPIMEKSAKYFKQILPELIKELKEPLHYVSFGIGDGKLDRKLVGKLKPPKGGLHYFPVDFSPEMLQVGIEEVKNFPGIEVLPIQIDFSEEENVRELRQTINQFVDAEPILFGLTGNTLANFKEDSELLNNFSSILKPNDKLLIGVSFTRILSEEAAKQAAKEYEDIELFKPFLTSGMLQNTDLSVEQGALNFEGGVEKDKALLINMYFQNSTDKDIQFRLPEGKTVSFQKKDTIRLLVSRKYSEQGIEDMIKKSNLHIYWSRYSKPYRNTCFGTAFLLVGKPA